MLPSGELIVRDVTEDDVSRRYICRTVHMMTDQHVVSRQPATITVDGPRAPSSPPRISASSAAQQVRTGEEVALFCIGHAAEAPPNIRWSRGELESSGPGTPPTIADEGVTARGPLLVFRPARPHHTGWYSC
ncbi:Down syndrome cell adhesion molecule-like protein Dscam2, partial [Pollicipes pollicipes]|uniref:Down syndrome cell adhesion molecule-like protein Dscam2 n=1 Tax=Pollicipes pollicipes TaxID=41117 RepID=UPI0018853B92